MQNKTHQLTVKICKAGRPVTQNVCRFCISHKVVDNLYAGATYFVWELPLSPDLTVFLNFSSFLSIKVFNFSALFKDSVHLACILSFNFALWFSSVICQYILNKILDEKIIISMIRSQPFLNGES